MTGCISGGSERNHYPDLLKDNDVDEVEPDLWKIFFGASKLSCFWREERVRAVTTRVVKLPGLMLRRASPRKTRSRRSWSWEPIPQKACLG